MIAVGSIRRRTIVSLSGWLPTRPCGLSGWCRSDGVHVGLVPVRLVPGRWGEGEGVGGEGGEGGGREERC